jgi:hypothetical protein
MLHLVHLWGDTLYKQFETIWHNMVQYKLAHQRKHHFCHNVIIPMIDDQTRQEGLLFPPFDLWKAGIK